MVTPLKKSNKNHVKISYSCTNSISKITDNRNKKLITKLEEQKHETCNCKIQNECPLEKKCNLNNIEYQANILAKENHNIDKAYIGMTSLNRYYNHLQSFRNPSIRNQSALIKYYWDLKELGLKPVINWCKILP